MGWKYRIFGDKKEPMPNMFVRLINKFRCRCSCGIGSVCFLHYCFPDENTFFKQKILKEDCTISVSGKEASGMSECGASYLKGAKDA